MNNKFISRRAWLAAAAAGGLACSRKKATSIQAYCFVANQGSRSVAAVSLENFRVRKQISLDGAPSMIAAHPSRPRVYALAPENGTVYEIDAGSLAATRRARVGNTAVAMRMAPAAEALWVLYRDPAVLVELPLNEFKPGRRIPLASAPDGFDVVFREDRKASLAAVASRAGRSIAVISLDQGSVVRTMPASAEPSLIQFQRDGKQLIVGSWEDRSILMFDVDSGKFVVRLPLPFAPRHFCAHSNGGQVFVTGDGMDAVAVVFPFQTEVYQTMLAGRSPGAMAFANPSYLLVSNFDDGGITVLDTDSYTLVAVVQVGQGPGEIQVTPDGQYALVLNERSGDLAVIRIVSLATTPNGAARRFKSAPLFTLIPVGQKPVSAAVVML